MSVIARVLFWGLGILFLISGGMKSIDARGAVMATAAYDILPAWQALLLGAVLPALEVVIGAALLVGCSRRPAAAWAIGLGVIFAIANGIAWQRGLVVDCQCFGGLGGTTPATSLWIDVVVVGAGALALLFDRRATRSAS